ncbi:MAG: chemotaxis protein CheW [Lachnospiraceae bacterium]
MKYLTFKLDESYALHMSCIVEIMEYKTVTVVPETPAYIAGVINIRGVVLPVIDMRARFRLPEASERSRRCIIIINFNDKKMGLIVDHVTDLIEISPEKVSPPPQAGTYYSHVFIKGIGILDSGMTLIVDTDKLVNLNELEFLEDFE